MINDPEIIELLQELDFQVVIVPNVWTGQMVFYVNGADTRNN